MLKFLLVKFLLNILVQIPESKMEARKHLEGRTFGDNIVKYKKGSDVNLC